MYFLGRRLLGERPRQHELGLEHRAGLLDDAVEGGGHPPDDRMPDAQLDVLDGLAALRSNQSRLSGLGSDAELDERLSERSCGSISPRFSCQSRRRRARPLP